MRWQAYHTPHSLDEALALLSEYAGAAQIVAGGTDLILDVQQGNHAAPQALVDVTTIRGLDQIVEEDGWIIVGAAVTHTTIEAHPRIRRYGAALAESCSVVGGPQVRNVATIGGNVAHALPAADGTIGLLALGAEVQVCTWNGVAVESTWQPLLSIFVGPGMNNLAPNQMISAFRFPAPGPHTGSAFDRIMRPQGVALPILGVAAQVTLDAAGARAVAAAIAVGPAGPIPFRALESEAILLAAPSLDDAAIDAAVAAAQGQAELRTSKHRASKAYRHEMLAVLLRRVLPRAIARARSWTTPAG
ncbi:MAG: FAD binding domain-containing protein [Caldilineaceae bacterium]|jgi:carbon-monoxide dehydrogenase medium subunit|nr:FAD binding domain-containing protein [Caldilineaceae bacterium]